MGRYRKFKGDVYRHNDSGILYLRVYTKTTGTKYRSLGDKKLTQRAREIADEYRKIVREGRITRSVYYRDVAKECFQLRMHRNRPRTVEEARYHYDRLIKAFGHFKIWEVSDAMWLEQIDIWLSEGKRSKFSHVAVYARQIDRYAFNRGYKNFRCEFPVADAPARVGRVITRAEFQRILAAAKKLPRQAKQVELFLLMARYMGMRRTEILALSRDRVDRQRRTLTLRAEDVKTGSRTGVGRTIRIARQVFPALVRMLDSHDSQWVFRGRKLGSRIESLRKSLDEVADEANVEFRPHDLRHTFITTKIHAEKKRPVDVSEYVGTSLSTIQKRYLHSRPEDTAGVVE